MSSDHLLIILTIAAAFALMAALLSGKPPKKASDSPKEVTRWKRFRVNPANVHGTRSEPAQVVVEEPKGLKLLAQPGTSSRRLRVADSKGCVRVEIADRWRPFTRRYRILIEGGARLDLVLPKGRGGRIAVEAEGSRDRYEIRGSIGDREYEILKNGKLVAIVSWQRSAPDEPQGKEYVLETLKTEEDLPLVALTLALEAAAA